ncbi:HIT family protein [Candidatus Solincola sp.]|nr:HIT domain-containing protein [Actinomycetota bacterium]MDI7252742.1 HIT domain-containing protein [Actinomycetota bacterium]
MERLWRPWRMQYIRMAQENGEGECIFCTKPAEGDDRSSLILQRGERCFIIMNLFPYNTGHLMVSPYRHVGELEDLDREELEELMRLTVLAVETIKEAMRPQGFNLGMNLGKVSGAGYDEHLHMHVVPRWQGDTNFMPVVAGTKVMPESLEENYSRLKEALERLLKREE